MRGNIKGALGKGAGVLGAGLLVTTTMLTVPLLAQSASAGVTGGGAAYTATDYTGASHATSNVVNGLTRTTTTSAYAGCLNGKATALNCNIYANKYSVWLNAGPVSNQLGQGTYFFAVLVPGRPTANDGGTGNLSYLTDGTWTNREFSVGASGTVTYDGSNGLDATNTRIQLWPYAPTTNPGGVYKLAICAVTPTDAATGTGTPEVTPSNCKFDAFKVKPAATSPTATAATSPTVVKNAAGTYTQSWTWGITKKVTTAKTKDVTQAGTSYTFHYKVVVTYTGPSSPSNVRVTGTVDVVDPNTTPITTVTVTDTLSTGTGCGLTTPGSGSSTTTLGPLTITPGPNRFTYTCTLSAVPGSSVTNKAVAVWTTQTVGGRTLPSGTATDTVHVNFTPTDVNGSVTVTDSVEGHLGSVTAATGTCRDSAGITCTPGATTTVVFTYTTPVAVTPGTCTQVTNAVTLSPGGTSGTSLATSSATAKLCVGADLTVSKTAIPKFTRTYNWTIVKLVTGKSAVTKDASSYTFQYTVKVKETGYVDSGFTVAGAITVVNPNTWESITATSVTDAITGGPTCTVTTGTDVTVAASGTVALHYSCTFSSNPGSVTNTATAHWNKTTYDTPDGSAAGTAHATFVNPTTRVHATVTPTDSFNGGTGVELCKLTTPNTTTCTLHATSSPTPRASHTYSYTRSVSAMPNACVTYPNTAKTGIVGATSSASVSLCGPVTGGLTMGFWQNKNGQALILHTPSCSALYAYLHGYAPFTLSSTSTCKAIASWVTKVIKSANAAGPTMVAMLKAQMLATALDVYFGFVGGGITVDLTNIYGMNVSTAFGGAAHLTVSQLLTYAASKYSAGKWYAVAGKTTKSLQGLAKTTFTAINNGRAFA